MSVIAHNEFRDEQVIVPDHIVERTEALLGEHPPTIQHLVLDTAQWWLKNVGNCAIFRWCIHHLDTLENDGVKQRSVPHSEARRQAEAIGMVVR